MIGYASRTGTRANLDALRAAGWRLLFTPSEPRTPPAGWAYALDNGAWTAHTRGQPFDGDAFSRAVDRIGRGADWIVIPDCVADRARSLEMAAEWTPRLRGVAPLMLAIQDGMSREDVAPWLAEGVGLFLGGSTAYKLASCRGWGAIARDAGVPFHVARVNSARRAARAREAGATSIDGSGPSRFRDALRRIERGVRQESFVW